jgi:hypothetical protein
LSTVAAPVSVSGTAGDNVGVAQVLVEIYNRDLPATPWWNGTGWQTARTQVSADVVPPDATSTDWTYVFDPPTAATLPYWVTVRSFDAAGNTSSYDTTNFTIN